MKKKIIAISCITIACLLLICQAVQATTTGFGFVKGDKFVWKWTFQQLKSGGIVTNTTTRYRMLNITNLVNNTSSVTLGVQLYTTNQSDYETNNVTGSHWGSTLLIPVTIHDGNATEAFNGFFNVVGVPLTTLSSMSTKVRSIAIMNMNILPVPEFFAFMLAVAFAMTNASNKFTNTTSVASASASAASTYIYATLGMHAGAHWNNMSIEVISKFNYDASRAILTSLDANVTVYTIQWWTNITAYHESSAMSHHVYSIVYPASLVPSSIDGYPVAFSVIATFTGMILILVRTNANRKKRT